MLRIVEQNAQAHNSVPPASQAEESEVHPSHQPIYAERSRAYDESDELDSVLRDHTLAQWRDEESDTSDEDEQLEEELRGATGLFQGPAEFLQGATGSLFQDHLRTMHSQHEEEDEDESEILRQVLEASQEEVLARSVAEQEERDQDALMCALALSISEQ